TVRNGVLRSTSFLITRNWPFCWHTKRRPSGANDIAVGLVNPLSTNPSVNPVGTVAAPTRATNRRNRQKKWNRNFMQPPIPQHRPSIRLFATPCPDDQRKSEPAKVQITLPQKHHLTH